MGRNKSVNFCMANLAEEEEEEAEEEEFLVSGFLVGSGSSLLSGV